jgi:hypothetical protein
MWGSMVYFIAAGAAAAAVFDSPSTHPDGGGVGGGVGG